MLEINFERRLTRWWSLLVDEFGEFALTARGVCSNTKIIQIVSNYHLCELPKWIGSIRVQCCHGVFLVRWRQSYFPHIISSVVADHIAGNWHRKQWFLPGQGDSFGIQSLSVQPRGLSRHWMGKFVDGRFLNWMVWLTSRDSLHGNDLTQRTCSLRVDCLHSDVVLGVDFQLRNCCKKFISFRGQLKFYLLSNSIKFRFKKSSLRLRFLYLRRKKN